MRSTSPVDAYAEAVVAGDVTIYALCDQREPDPVLQVRYIGQTSGSLRRRYTHHICMARRGGQTYRDNWIRSVFAGGGDVAAQVLAVVPSSRWAIAEREFIGRYRALGARLTNDTDGGEGMPNPSAETRQKLRDAFKGKPLTEEHKRNIGLARLGLSPDADHRAKIRAELSNRKLSDETRMKMSAARIGRKLSKEHSAKISAAKKAYYASHPEHRQKHREDMRARRKAQGGQSA